MAPGRIPLDEIEVAMALELSYIKDQLDDLPWSWGPYIRKLLDDDVDPSTWCDIRLPPPMSPENLAKTKTRMEYVVSLKKLERMKVLTKLAAIDHTKRLFFSYFEVPKASRVKARAIGNCKRMATHFGPPRRMRLITPNDIFKLLRFFRNPKFAELDFRHWFHQITLPSTVRKWFTTSAGWEQFEFNVWPMGFKWTPVVAQAISLSICCAAVPVMETILGNRKFTVTSPLPDQEEVPPYLELRENGNIIAFFVVYLDNILCIANCEQIANTFAAAFENVCSPEKSNAQIKQEDPADPKIRKWFNHEVKFLGVHFHCENRNVKWKHASVEQWAHLNPTNEMIRRQVSEIVGVVIWNWTIGNYPLLQIRDVINIASEIGRLCVNEDEWDEPISLSDEQVKTLKDALEEVRRAGRVWQQRLEMQYRVDKVFPMASDSSDPKGAFMYFKTDLTDILMDRAGASRSIEHDIDPSTIPFKEVTWSWQDHQKHLPINRKEVLAALAAACQVIPLKAQVDPDVEQAWLVPLAIDNTTACASLRTWCFPACPELALELEEDYIELRRHQIFVVPVQVTSEEEAADSATRDQVSTLERRIKTLNRLRWAVAVSEVELRRPLGLQQTHVIVSIPLRKGDSAAHNLPIVTSSRQQYV